MHHRNLRALTPYLHRAAMWRVRLNNVYEVQEVVRGARGGPPQSNEFSLRVTADGNPPTSGHLTRLTDKMESYVRSLVNDLQKISKAKQLAHEDAVATQDSTLGDAHVEEMMRAVGALPISKVEVEEQARQRAAVEEAVRAARLAADEREVQTSLGELSLEEEMRKAEKKAAKRARQKANRKEAKLQQTAEASGSAQQG